MWAGSRGRRVRVGGREGGSEIYIAKRSALDETHSPDWPLPRLRHIYISSIAGSFWTLGAAVCSRYENKIYKNAVPGADT